MQFCGQMQYKLPNFVHVLLFQMRRLLLIGMFCFFTALLRAQIAVPDTLLLDSMAIVKESVQGRLDSMLIPQHDYRVDAWKGRLILQPGYDWSKIKWKYQTYPFRTWIGQFPLQQQRRDQVIQPAQRQREQFEGGLGGLKTNGFISRGIQL